MSFDLSMGELLILSLFFITGINCALTYFCCTKSLKILEDDKSINKAIVRLRRLDQYVLSKVNLLIALIYFALSYLFIEGFMNDTQYMFFFSCLLSFVLTLFTTFISRLCYCYTCNVLLETKLNEIECLIVNFKRLVGIYTPFVVISLIVPSIYLIDMPSLYSNIICGVSLLLVLVVSILLTPRITLFNYNAKMIGENSALKYYLDKLMEMHGIKKYKIYVWDTSKSKEDNAMVSGVGTYYLFISSTLIENVTLPELETIVTHEIGHIKNNHLIKKMIGKFFIVAPLGLLTIMPNILDFNGLNRGLVYLLVVLLSFLGILISIGVDRKYELEADLYVARYNDPDLFASALKKISKYEEDEESDNKGDELFQSHPDVKTRMKKMKEKDES